MDRGETVAAAINGHLEWLAETWKKPFTVAIATAYINPGGFASDRVGPAERPVVRLLIGAEPEPPIARIRSLDEDEPSTARALEGHERPWRRTATCSDSAEADASARRFVDWLRSGVVEVRRFEDGFLHGKAYLVDTDDEGVIAGSSNFTTPGCRATTSSNLGQYDPKDVAPVREWLDEMWDRAQPYRPRRRVRGPLPRRTRRT